MQMKLVVALSVSLFALAVDAAEPTKAPTSAAKQTVSYGKPFTNAPAVPVAEVLAATEKFEGKSVKITGTVTQVCQKKGCWFEVAPADKGRGIRIKSADYSIFVPFDSAGRKATVEGTLVVKTLNEAQAKHMAEDGARAGEKPAEVKGPVKELQLAAVSVELN